MDKNKKKLLLMVVAILGLIVITAGVTYAFFSYTKEGTKDNTITTGTITFLYTEVSGVGKGISLTDAFPITDTQGKKLTGEGNVFDFKVTSTTPNKTAIPYEVTARKSSDSNLVEEAVKIYLTKVSGTSEEEVLLAKYSNLTQTSKVQESKYTEKTIYTGKVPADSPNYEENFRLRMWVDEDTNFSPDKDGNYPYNDKKFTITVNVYANAKVVTEEDIQLESNTNISNLSVGGEELVQVENEDYDYKTTLPVGTTSTAILVETENEYAKVEIERIDSLVYKTSNVKRMATTKEVELLPGDNYFRVTVTSEDGKLVDDYKIKIEVVSMVKGSSILSILQENDISDGKHKFVVDDKSYNVHLINFDGDQVFTESQTFGDDGDVGTATTDAQNMVIVKVDGDLTINSGVTIEPHFTEYGGPKGFTLYVTGTLTNNGIIDNSHGAKAVGEDVYLWRNEDGSYEYVPANGATGGGSVSYANGIDGNPGSGRATGGGGSGSGEANNSRPSGAGGRGTSYSGGTGGGAIGYTNTGAAGAGIANGGAGGFGYFTKASGGAGNPGGNPDSQGAKGSNGTGGLLVVYADNYINNGTVRANGSNGGNLGYGGGSSGGGSINIFYSSSIVEGTSQKNGGSRLGVTRTGGAGGAGTVTIGAIKDGNFFKPISNFDYSKNGEQKFVVPVSGNYKIEAWGAQGGTASSTIGGYGAYSTGTIYLNKSQTLYINVGGMGSSTQNSSRNTITGGYNGGGSGYQMSGSVYAAGGGGATHISTKSGLLSTLSNDVDSILIVAGGGAGGYYYSGKSFVGNSGGGYMGGYSYDASKAGTQTSGYKFGQGGRESNNPDTSVNNAGGGGGFYGGYSMYGESGAGGGSSYIGNSNLDNKVMYCYNCKASTDDLSEEYKTIKTTSVSSSPVSNNAKSGNGYVRITFGGK